MPTNEVFPTCFLAWLLQGLPAEQCPDADHQGVGADAGDLHLHQRPGAGVDLHQSRLPPPDLLTLLLHFRSPDAAEPADDSAAVSLPKNQVVSLPGLQGCILGA